MNDVLQRSDAYLRQNIGKTYVDISDGSVWNLVGIHYDIEDFYWQFQNPQSTLQQYLSLVCDPEQYGFERLWEGQT